jgi:hypothetical protein
VNRIFDFTYTVNTYIDLAEKLRKRMKLVRNFNRIVLFDLLPSGIEKIPQASPPTKLKKNI